MKSEGKREEEVKLRTRIGMNRKCDEQERECYVILYLYINRVAVEKRQRQREQK